MVYLGVDTRIFKPGDRSDARKKLGLPMDKKIILHVGSEEPRKNINGLIKSFYGLAKEIPDSVLLRVGEKSSESEKLIGELGIGGKVTYLSGLGLTELSLAYNASDVFVFPSFEEGFGLPVLEAMACGVPVVASNAASLPEIMGEGGSMVEPGDLKKLTGAINAVLKDENIRQSLIDGGIKNVENFSWERTAKETKMVYDEVYDGS